MKQNIYMNCRFLFLIGFIVFSCNNEPDLASFKIITSASIEEHFVPKIQLTGENFGPDGQFGYIVDIFLVDSTLIVQDQKKDFGFFALKNKNEIFPFQPIGYEPSQVKSPDLIDVVSYNEQLNELHFFNYSTKSLNVVKIEPNSVFKEVCKVPGIYWGEVQSAISLSDSLVAVTGLFSDTKFVVFNKYNQKETLRSQYVNSFRNEFSEKGKVATAPRNIKYNTKHSSIILQNPSVNSIDIYSVDGKLDKMYSFGDYKNISENDEFSRSYFYYYSVKTRDDVVYGLYLGLGQDLMAKTESFLSQTYPELHIFNLATDKLSRFTLDRMVNVCVFETKKNTIYCVEENNENQPLVRYEIPEIH